MNRKSLTSCIITSDAFSFLIINDGNLISGVKYMYKASFRCLLFKFCLKLKRGAGLRLGNPNSLSLNHLAYWPA